ncbi:MAG: major capsid protein [Microvirus sp.]|nr:MAG: major capsid protein [Microvirus sp.]
MGKNIFNTVKLTRPKKSVFDLSHDVKQTMRFGELTPILAMECVPGDKIKIQAETLIRMAPLISPVMHRIDATIHYFFVPNRILWPNWEAFITNASSGIAHPYIDLAQIPNVTAQEKQIWRFLDYMGVPPITGTYPPACNVNCLAFAAYQRIYQEYYRDQNLINLGPFQLTDGNNTQRAFDGMCEMKLRAWEHDYFTSALPWAQKGQDVLIPSAGNVYDPTKYATARQVPTGIVAAAGNLKVEDTTGHLTNESGTQYVNIDQENATGGVDSGTINDLRTAQRLQKWLEKNARGGSRYVENILEHFGIKSQDARLNRPEYICGLKTPVVISEVLNTAGVTDSPAQGNMAGHGVAVNSGSAGSYFCQEHGYIIGIMSIMPKTAYQQGIQKQYLKSDALSYYWPSFAHLGEQEIENQELYAYGPNPQKTFGYVPRYSEYKFFPSRVAGDFRTTLAFWHMGRIFANEPALNQAFVECKPDDRIFAVIDPEVDNIYVDVYNKITAIRPMPKYGTPQ